MKYRPTSVNIAILTSGKDERKELRYRMVRDVYSTNIADYVALCNYIFSLEILRLLPAHR